MRITMRAVAAVGAVVVAMGLTVPVYAATTKSDPLAAIAATTLEARDGVVDDSIAAATKSAADADSGVTAATLPTGPADGTAAPGAAGTEITTVIAGANTSSIATPLAPPAHASVAAQSGHPNDASATGTPSTPFVEAGRTGRRICNYVYGARCVTWVTTLHSCHNIFQLTRDGNKLKACAIYASKGIVTVWP